MGKVFNRKQVAQAGATAEVASEGVAAMPVVEPAATSTPADLYRPAYGGGFGAGAAPGALAMPGAVGGLAAYGGGSMFAPQPAYPLADPTQSYQQQAGTTMMGAPHAPAEDSEQRHMGMGISSIYHPDMAGMMLKCRFHNLNPRGRGSNWEARYFILKNQVLLCYESDPTKPGADPKKMSKYTVWYNPDEVAVGDAGNGSGPAVILQQLDNDPFLLKAPDGSDATLVDQWAEALRAAPPELQRALDALKDTKAQLMKARRDLRNQAMEKEQVDEHLESLTAVKDQQFELMEELKVKHDQLISYDAQLNRERAERSGLEEQLRRSQQAQQELEEQVYTLQEQLHTEREKAKQLVAHAKKEAQKARRQAERAQDSSHGFAAAADAAWLRITSICRDQGPQIVEILAAFDDRPELPGTVDYREFVVGMSQLDLDCKAPRVHTLLSRFTKGSGSRRRVAYREAISAIGAQAAQAAEDVAAAADAGREKSTWARSRAAAAVGNDLRVGLAMEEATSGFSGASVSSEVKGIFAEFEAFLKRQLQECVDNCDVVVAHADAKSRVQKFETQLHAARADLERERERDAQSQMPSQPESQACAGLRRQIVYYEEQHSASQAECSACAQQKDRHFGDPNVFQQKCLDVEGMLVSGRRKLADVTTKVDQQANLLAQTKAGLHEVLDELKLKEQELVTAKQRLRRMAQQIVDDLPSLTIRPAGAVVEDAHSSTRTQAAARQQPVPPERPQRVDADAWALHSRSTGSPTGSAEGGTSPFREDANLTISQRARDQQAKAEAARARRTQSKTESYASESVPPTRPASLRPRLEPEPEPEPGRSQAGYGTNLHSEWEALTDDAGETSYYNRVDGTRASQPPDGWIDGGQPAVPGLKINPDSEWVEYEDTDGSPYYSNTKTGDTVWEVPAEGVSASERLDKMVAAATSQ